MQNTSSAPLFRLIVFVGSYPFSGETFLGAEARPRCSQSHAVERPAMIDFLSGPSEFWLRLAPAV